MQSWEHHVLFDAAPVWYEKMSEHQSPVCTAKQGSTGCAWSLLSARLQVCMFVVAYGPHHNKQQEINNQNSHVHAYGASLPFRVFDPTVMFPALMNCFYLGIKVSFPNKRQT